MNGTLITGNKAVPFIIFFLFLFCSGLFLRSIIGQARTGVENWVSTFSVLVSVLVR